MKTITPGYAMTGLEKALYEKMIPNSTTLLHLSETSFPSKSYNNEYINILFSFRCSTKDYDKLIKLVQDIVDSSESGYEVDIFCLHKTIRSYISNIRSTVEYSGALSKRLCRREKVDLEFDKKLDTTCNDISKFRNEVLHEKIPQISFYNLEEEYVTCPAYASGKTRIRKYVTIEFKEPTKSFELGEFTEVTYNCLKNLVEGITNDLLCKITPPTK